MFLLFFYLSIALLISFLCSILEAALLSTTSSYIEALEQKGDKTGTKLKKLKENVDRPLSAILSLNTIAHTVGAAGVGAQAVQVFGDAYVGIISGVLTFLILILSEIIPKTLGVSYWRNLAGFSANALSIIIMLMYPLVVLSKGISKLIARETNHPLVSRSEISAMADMGHKEGVFLETESRILKNLVKLKSVKVYDIMTPRTVVLTVPENMTLAKLYEQKENLRFSRIPVYEEQVDNVSGYIHKHDLLDRLAKDEHSVLLSEIKRDIMMVNEEMPIIQLFEKLISEKEHIALAIDEYGGMTGVVTMEDVIETLLGLEITDEFDNTQDMQEYARQRWKKRAKKLGIITDEEVEIKENAIKFGLTGTVDASQKQETAKEQADSSRDSANNNSPKSSSN